MIFRWVGAGLIDCKC